jgi:hypothetical protein
MLKLYKLVKVNSLNNPNCIEIQINKSNGEKSWAFVTKCYKKVKEIYGTGASLSNIVTTNGVCFRFPTLEENTTRAKKIIILIENENKNYG